MVFHTCKQKIINKQKAKTNIFPLTFIFICIHIFSAYSFACPLPYHSPQNKLPSHIVKPTPEAKFMCINFGKQRKFATHQKMCRFYKASLCFWVTIPSFPQKNSGSWIVDRLLAFEYSRPSSSTKKRLFSLDFLFSCLLLCFFWLSAPHFTLLSSLSARLLSRVR